MAELRVLQTGPDMQRASVVETLERVLADARAGVFTGIAIAATRSEGGAHHAWSDRAEAHALLGAVAILQFELCAEIHHAAAGAGPIDG